MALTQRLEFRQSQSLVMTPQLMQAIKLLQLSNLDLSAFVEEELERNPLLDRASDGPEAPVAGEPTAERAEFSDSSSYGDEGGDTSDLASGAAGDGFEPGQEDWLNRDLGSRAEIEQTLDTPLDNVFSEEPAEAAARVAQDAAPTAYTEWGGGASNDDGYNLEAFVAAEVTLGSHLAEQLAVAFSGPVQRMIGQYLIDLVDDAGYLPPDLGQAAERLGASQGDVDAVLSVLQKFDPPGVCARNLSECLAIQLRELNRYDPAMRALVENLDLLAKRDIASLRKLCGVDDEDITDMIGEIGFVAVLADRLRQLGVIDLIDQHARQRVAVEFDMPSAVRAGPHIDVRHHGLRARGAEFQAGLWIEAADLADHVGDVVVIDAAELS